MKRLLAITLTMLTFSIHSFAEEQQGLKEVLIDNDKVQLVRLTYPPGSESGMHEHVFANRTVYFVKGGKLQLIPANINESTKTLIVHDGKSLYMPATTHNVRNIGTTKIVIIENEIKN